MNRLLNEFHTEFTKMELTSPRPVSERSNPGGSDPSSTNHTNHANQRELRRETTKYTEHTKRDLDWDNQDFVCSVYFVVSPF